MGKPDINFLSMADPNVSIVGKQIIVPVPAAGSYWSDAVHISAANCTLDTVTIDARQCEENAVDINHTQGITVTNATILAGRECALYAKASQNVTFRHCLLSWVGGNSDLYLGDFSDQSRARTTGIVVEDCQRIDGLPLRISWNLLRADKPQVKGTSWEFQFWLSLVRTLYVEGKYLLRALHLA